MTFTNLKTKKINLVLSLLMSITFYANAYEPASFLKNENIKGKVKSITNIYTNVKYTNEQRKNVYVFNPKGQMTKNTYYWQDKPSSSLTEYTYDVKGFLISEKVTDPTKGTVESKDVYLNDLKGNPIKKTTYYNGSTKASYITTYTRNTAGKILTERTKTLPENITYYPKFTNKYDVKGNKIEEYVEYGSGDFSKSKYQLTYNKKGKIEKEIENKEFTSHTYDGNEYKTYISTYKYDEKDRILTIKDKDGNITQQYVYDDKGNITKENDKEYIYEYDEKGNWIKKSTKEQVEIYCTEERTYVYL